MIIAYCRFFVKIDLDIRRIFVYNNSTYFITAKGDHYDR